MRTSLKSFLLDKSRLLQLKSHFVVFPECRSYPGILPQRCHARSRQGGRRTVISHSDGHSIFKVQLGGICQDRKFDLSAKRKIKSRHISTLIIGESFALASNQMLICDGFESFKRPYCLRRLNSTLNSTKNNDGESRYAPKGEYRRYSGLVPDYTSTKTSYSIVYLIRGYYIIPCRTFVCQEVFVATRTFLYKYIVKFITVNSICFIK